MSTTAITDKVRQAVSDVFGVPYAEISADSSPQTVEAWDSMGHLNLVLALEQSFGVQFSPEEIAGMASVRAAAETLAKKRRVTVPPIAGSPAIGAPAAGSAAGAPELIVRPTTPADLDAVVSLLSERDGHALTRAHVASSLFGLEPSLLAGWIALADGRPAGLTTLYTRQQGWGDRTIRAGYWSHLFVPERFRRLMVYPQLVLAMMRGIKPLGIDCIFTGTRRAHVAEGHVKLGFAKLGEYRVLYKPLRPFRLLARYKNWPGPLHIAAIPGDALYSAYLAVRRAGTPAGLTVRPVDRSGPEIDSIVAMLNSAGGGRVSQAWTPESLRRRLGTTIDGYDYRILTAQRGGHTVGGLIYRRTIRERVAAGIIMEIVGSPDEPTTSGALLSEAERCLLADGADTTLYLDALGPAASNLLRASGHRLSSETYQMLVWPKPLVPAGSTAADLANWRFSFLDHDAF